MKPPPYFESVRLLAARRWDQLEQDPELAGPWRQLFRQVQSPRHVLSELLQNADDAGATKAFANVQNGVFTFSHNGSDFTEEQFSSLCRFGYSNKRSLHTIGFRGIGFKSVFSLGDRVSLTTPTISVYFDRIRFSDPVWQGESQHSSNLTAIRVAIRDPNVQRDFEKNLQEWLLSPSSLLFFRNIRSLSIGDRELSWVHQGHGPVVNSEWFTLTGNSENPHLVVWSPDEEIPTDAIKEIRDERNIDEVDGSAIPKCRVEIVLGLKGRLFVILPTGVKTSLPFGCNAPFLQDPARTRIKDPETSPTNRWLLKRVGNLAASAMLEWLSNDKLDTKQRAEAYDLLPDVDRDDNSLEGLSATTVELAFEEHIDGIPCVLSESLKLELPEQCFTVPDILFNIWSYNQIATYFAGGDGQILHPDVSETSKSKLLNWGCVNEIGKLQILHVLKSTHLERPQSWSQLMSLWAFVSGDVHGFGVDKQINRGICVVPVQGQNVLYSANEVVRLGDKRLLYSEDDWQFLASRLVVLDPNWPRYLSEKRRVAEETPSSPLSNLVKDAYVTLESLGLKEASDANTVFQRTALKFFQEESHTIKDCVRLAQIAACLGIKAGDHIRYVTRDKVLRAAKWEVIDDIGQSIDEFFESHWLNEHVLHDAYHNLISCTKDQWNSWVSLGRSGLTKFVSIQRKEQKIFGRNKLMSFLKKRGCKTQPNFPYVTNTFVIYDWDFSDEHWSYWHDKARYDESYWASLLEQIFFAPIGYWNGKHIPTVEQIATNASRRNIEVGELLPSWIARFRDLPCLIDTNGKICQPAELLRRTPDTESLINIEPFVRAEVDNESNRLLLALLGVRDTPTGSAKLIERLRALSICNVPPLNEIEKWYNQIDRLIGKCSTDELHSICSTFRAENLILTTDNKWANSTEAYIEANDAEVPGVALVHSAVRHLNLWRKIGVNDRPTVDIAMNWLATIVSGEVLSQDRYQRVRSILQKHHFRVWNERKHWLNLERRWTPVSKLTYCLTMQSLMSWKHLFAQVKEKTADFQMLSAELCYQLPFSSIRSLSQSVTNELYDKDEDIVGEYKMQWMEAFGESVSRIIIEDEDVETERIRKLGRRLANTIVKTVNDLTLVPYVDGLPAGEARPSDALWRDEVLYTASKSEVRLAAAMSEEIARAFARQDMSDAIKLCYGRPPAYVQEFIKENFQLENVKNLTITHSIDMETSANLIDAQEEFSDYSKVHGHISEVNDETVHHASIPVEKRGKDYYEECSSNKVAADTEATTYRESSKRQSRESGRNTLGLIERFALMNEFKRESETRYYHPDGRWLTRCEKSSLFHWELRSMSGKLLRNFWVSEQSLRDDSILIGSDSWTLFTSKPEMCALILMDENGNPAEFVGRDLLRMQETGQLKVFPAKYRLVYTSL